MPPLLSVHTRCTRLLTTELTGQYDYLNKQSSGQYDNLDIPDMSDDQYRHVKNDKLS